MAKLSPAMRWGLLVCLILAFAFGSVGFFMLFRYHGVFTVVVALVIIILVGLILAIVMTLLFAALKRLPWQTFLVICISIILVIGTLFLAIYLIPLMIFSIVCVYLIVMFATKQYKALGRLKKILRYSLLGLSSTVVVILLALIIWQGPSLSPDDRPEEARLALPYVERIQSRELPILENPSLHGNYNHRVYFYATSKQRLNPYPGENVLPASTADASELLMGWSGMRRWQLGFEPDALPLNAQVWMPEGEGPFPLTLIVHGNHNAGNRSDGGYAYLGEFLASRGIIAASVDQNFLNSSPLYDMLFMAGLEKENGVRAFVLLEHLRQWYAWNADPSHPFSGAVDFDRIALIGHSRGGEAAALAAAFADLSYYPGNGAVVFDYPFRINTVIAIAPVHRQYNPAGLEVYLTSVNYLVLHGGHDKDVSSFMGADMYNRVDVSDYGIKASVWVQHANHGQFNTIWGDNDLPGLSRLLTNQRLLMSLAEQQSAAKVFIGAFLEATLHGREEYTVLFRDFAHGADWLPPALYITTFADSNMVILDSFDEGFDLSTSTSNLITYSGQGFDRWTRTALPNKWGAAESRVLMLQWGSADAQEPVMTADFAESTLFMGDSLYLSLSSGNQSMDDPNVSFQIRLTDSSGRTSTMHINDFGGVTNPIDAHIFSPVISAIMGSTSEPVLQMISIPTEQFEGLQGEIVSMEWIMESMGITQILYIDNLLLKRSSE